MPRVLLALLLCAAPLVAAVAVSDVEGETTLVGESTGAAFACSMSPSPASRRPQPSCAALLRMPWSV